MKLRMTLDENGVKALLLCVQTASETTWTNEDVRSLLVAFKDRVETAVKMQMPSLVSFLDEVGAPMGDFS